MIESRHRLRRWLSNSISINGHWTCLTLAFTWVGRRPSEKLCILNEIHYVTQMLWCLQSHRTTPTTMLDAIELSKSDLASQRCQTTQLKAQLPHPRASHSLLPTPCHMIDWLIRGTDIVGHQTQWASMVIGPALTSAFTSMCRRLLQYLCTLNGSQLKTTNLSNTERYGTCKARNHTNMAMFDELRIHDSGLESPTISSTTLTRHWV